MKRILLILIAGIILYASSVVFAEDNNDFQGVWVATVLNLDYPSKPGLTNAELKNEADRILEQVESMGMNAVILQVRPTSDSFYNSEIFPWSKYLTGKQGVSPVGGFDPLAYWIEEAHKRDIEVHAWINPYRITRKTSTEPEHDFMGLASSHPAIKHPEWVVKHTDGNLYFDPGIPQVMDLIVSGVVELIENYDVDGIHFDDYFYPGTDFNDLETYRKFGSNYNNIHDWRRANVNELIIKTHNAVEQYDPSIDFGVSPFAIWMNAKNNSLGSATNGLESYTSHYADSRLWVKNQWIDYIAPQIYWNIGYEIADYEILLNWWNQVVENTNVDLYIGHAAYRVENKSPSSPWFGVMEIDKQLKMNQQTKNVSGSIFFRYGFFENHYSLRTLMRSYNDPDSKIKSNQKLILSRPVGGVRTTANEYFIGGSSNPSMPLTLNGKPVDQRTSNGYFGVFVPLAPGINKFVFTQGDTTLVKEIERIEPAIAKPMTKAGIVESSVFPKSNMIVQPGEIIRFKATAPAGSTMTVTVGGKAYRMEKSTTKYSSNLSPISFYYDYEVPAFIGQPQIIPLGNPTYEMTYDSVVDQMKSIGGIEIYRSRVPVTATVIEDYADSYQVPYTSNGAHYLLIKGMSDLVTGKENGFLRLSSGIWVKEEAVQVQQLQVTPWLNIARLTHKTGDDYEDIIVESPQTPVAGAIFDGEKIKFEMARTLVVSTDSTSSSGNIESIQTETEMDKSIVSISLKDSKKMGGYEVLRIDGKLVLRIYNRFKITSSEKPLQGAVIVIDPGHGGSDPGAIGLQGMNNTEKNINFNISNQLKSILEEFGATVYMTRQDDSNRSLTERLWFSKSKNPDLFISVHADSVGETLNLNTVSGFSAFYKDPMAKELAEKIQNTVISNLNRNNRNVKTANFYVVRGTWAPSVLIETGFMPNPYEYEWMMDSVEQRLFAHTIAKAIVDYFR